MGRCGEDGGVGWVGSRDCGAGSKRVGGVGGVRGGGWREDNQRMSHPFGLMGICPIRKLHTQKKIYKKRKKITEYHAAAADDDNDDDIKG